jgi:hypothetical protein
MRVDVQRFDLPVAVTLRLQSRSGKIEVIAEPRDDVLVEGEAFSTSEEDGGATLEVRAGRGGSKSLSVRCPAGTDIIAGTHSGSVRMAGDLGAISVTTMSGAIDVDCADEADLRSASANITLRKCRDRCRMNSMSGTISAGEVGSASAGTVSGSIKIDHVAGSLKARTVSGSIEAAADGEGAIAVKTVSGKVRVELPQGTALQTRFKTLSGHVQCPFPAGSDCRVEAMTISGSIELVPG